MQMKRLLVLGVSDRGPADTKLTPQRATLQSRRGLLPGSGMVQASHLKSSLGSDGCPIPARLTAAILNS